TSGDFDTNVRLNGAPDEAFADDELEIRKALEKMPTGVAARDVHAWMLRQTTRFVEIAQMPDDEQGAPILAWHDAIQHGPEGRQLLPAAPKMIEACLRHHAETHCAAVALAIERYRLKNHDWPEKLADLCPEFIKAVPADPYDGKSLRYRLLSD